MTQPQHHIEQWAKARWYVHLLLFPALLTAILLGTVALLGYWWLWLVALAIALPALVILFAPAEDRRAEDLPWLKLP